MRNKKLKFNVFFNTEGEELEKLIIPILSDYLHNNIKVEN